MSPITKATCTGVTGELIRSPWLMFLLRIMSLCWSQHLTHNQWDWRWLAFQDSLSVSGDHHQNCYNINDVYNAMALAICPIPYSLRLKFHGSKLWVRARPQRFLPWNIIVNRRHRVHVHACKKVFDQNLVKMLNIYPVKIMDCYGSTLKGDTTILLGMADTIPPKMQPPPLIRSC